MKYDNLDDTSLSAVQIRNWKLTYQETESFHDENR